MWNFLSTVARTFLLFRDVFGYLIPGVVLLGSVAYRFRIDWATIKTAWAGAPEWLAIAVAVIACYVAGQVLVACGYFLIFDLPKIFAKPEDDPDATKVEKIKENADLLFVRYIYPDLCIDRDRRDTINILRVGLSIAFLIDASLLLPDYSLSFIAFLLGSVMFHNGYTGAMHVREFSKSTVAAGASAMAKKVPFATHDGAAPAASRAQGKKSSARKS